MWGPPVAVELQVLHLLELRQLALDPGLERGGEKWIQARWIAILREACPDALPGLAAPWLEAHDRVDDLPSLLERLCTDVRARMDGREDARVPRKDRDVGPTTTTIEGAMYVTAHHVRRRNEGQPEEAGVNAFVHLHGRTVRWPRDAARLADEEPGREVLELRDAKVSPGGNEVRSYLDVLAPDGTEVGTAEAALAKARALLPEGNPPVIVTHAGVTVRFGLQFGLYSVRTEEFDRLAAKVVDRWGRVPRATAAASA
jgi:hypothetical protein